MEKRQGRDGQAAMAVLELLTQLLIPFQLGGSDIIVGMDLFQPFENDGIHGVEQIEHPVRSISPLQPDSIVGTTVHGGVRRCVQAAGQAPDQGINLFTGRTELGVMVTQCHRPGDATFGQRRENLLGALQVRLAKEDVSGMDDQIRFYALQGLFHAFQRPGTAGVSRYVMRIRELHHGKGTVGPIGQGGRQTHFFLTRFIGLATGSERGCRSSQYTGPGSVFEEGSSFHLNKINYICVLTLQL